MCGLRLVHLSALELFKYEAHCSIPGYTKPFCPTNSAAGSASPVKYDTHVLPVVCLAFYAAGSGGVSAGSGNFSGTTWEGVKLYKRAADEWVAQGSIGVVA